MNLRIFLKFVRFFGEDLKKGSLLQKQKAFRAFQGRMAPLWDASGCFLDAWCCLGTHKILSKIDTFPKQGFAGPRLLWFSLLVLQYLHFTTNMSHFCLKMIVWHLSSKKRKQNFQFYTDFGESPRTQKFVSDLFFKTYSQHFSRLGVYLKKPGRRYNSCEKKSKKNGIWGFPKMQK